MGWNTQNSLLLSAPPYVFAVSTSFEAQDHTYLVHDIHVNQAISVFVFAWISDRMRMRAVFLAMQSVVTIVGLALAGYAGASGVRYFG